MITLKINMDALQQFYNKKFYGGQTPGGVSVGFATAFNSDVKLAGGRINTYGNMLIDGWAVEFDNEQDAVAFKLRFGL